MGGGGGSGSPAPADPPRRFWLMKSEPEEYSIDKLQQDGKTAWIGVRNHQAKNFMRDTMRPGDGVLFYHSNADPSAIVGLASVCSTPYPDPSQFDKRNKYYDPKATQENPKWFLVDVRFEQKFPRPISLEELKQHGSTALQGMMVVRKGARLSIQPVDKAHFQWIVDRASAPAAAAAAAAGV